MDFTTTDRAREYEVRLRAFVDERVAPSEAICARQIKEAGDAHAHPAVLEELKAEARDRGLWNLFLTRGAGGHGLTVSEYAPLAELMGRSPLAAEACNCSPPDSGNMEVLATFGSPGQQETWLTPLLEGQIRSGFAMTEPGVASSDATSIALRIERDGNEYVLNGRKWWTTGAFHRLCRVLLVMGITDPDGLPHAGHSIVLVPTGTPGLAVVRDLPVFGYAEREGHGELTFTDVRVPVANLLGTEGEGFKIAQTRLGPGRIHHCMRALGCAELALELMCRRALHRTTFGEPLASRANIQDWIAESRIDIDMGRLLVMNAAWKIDTRGAHRARGEIAAIKVAVPSMALRVVDRAIQVHGGAGVSDDFPLARAYSYLRTLRLIDGPDEVHKMSLARRELRAYAASGAAGQPR